MIGERADDVVGLDRVGRVGDEWPAVELAVASDVDEHGAADDAAAGPVVHTVFLVVDAVVVPVHEMAHVAKAVPLRRALRVERVELVVVPGGGVEHHMMRTAATEQRRIGKLELEVEVEDGAVDDARQRVLHALGCEQVQTAGDVVVAPQSPGRAERCIVAHR